MNTMLPRQRLVAAAVEGDREAARELLSDIAPGIVRYCRSRIGYGQHRYSSADDVAQEALIGLLQALPSYRGHEDRFLAFAFGIVRNKIADYYRARAQDRSTPTPLMPEMPDASPQPEQYTLRAELGARLSSLLDTLAPGQREVLMLRIVVGLSTEETASAMSTTAGAVRVTQHRALTNLRRRLAPGDRPVHAGTTRVPVVTSTE